MLSPSVFLQSLVTERSFLFSSSVTTARARPYSLYLISFFFLSFLDTSFYSTWIYPFITVSHAHTYCHSRAQLALCNPCWAKASHLCFPLHFFPQPLAPLCHLLLFTFFLYFSLDIAAQHFWTHFCLTKKSHLRFVKTNQSAKSWITLKAKAFK